MLAGSLIGDDDNLQDVGIFRVTGSDPKIRQMEVHLAKGNYAYLATQPKPESHTVTNYWKRLLRAMKEPLIPYDLYDKFLWTSRVEITNGE